MTWVTKSWFQCNGRPRGTACPVTMSVVAGTAQRDAVRSIVRMGWTAVPEGKPTRHYCASCTHARVWETHTPTSGEVAGPTPVRRGDEVRAAFEDTRSGIRAAEALIRAGFDTVAKVAEAPDADLLDSQNIGARTLAVVRAAIPAAVRGEAGDA